MHCPHYAAAWLGQRHNEEAEASDGDSGSRENNVCKAAMDPERSQSKDIRSSVVWSGGSAADPARVSAFRIYPLWGRIRDSAAPRLSCPEDLRNPIGCAWFLLQRSKMALWRGTPSWMPGAGATARLGTESRPARTPIPRAPSWRRSGPGLGRRAWTQRPRACPRLRCTQAFAGGPRRDVPGWRPDNC